MSSGQFIINPQPNLRPFFGGFPYFSPPFGVTSAGKVVINCPDVLSLQYGSFPELIPLVEKLGHGDPNLDLEALRVPPVEQNLRGRGGAK